MSPNVLGVSAYLLAELADRYHWGELNHLLLDQVRFEVARPVRRKATRATPLAQLHRAFEMTEFDAKAGERAEPKVPLEAGATRR